MKAIDLETGAEKPLKICLVSGDMVAKREVVKILSAMYIRYKEQGKVQKAMAIQQAIRRFA